MNVSEVIIVFAPLGIVACAVVIMVVTIRRFRS